MNCPNCGAEMPSRSFARRYGPPITLDICHACQGIWFDDQELLQLSPGATLELLAAIGDVQAGARQTLAPRLTCPRCSRRLAEVQDQQRNTRFSYFKCSGGHGRFLTFYQFLRAKNFVRQLASTEIEELKRRIRQVNCVNCGAPVDIDRGVACGHCRTPITMLDPDQVRKAVDSLRAAEAERTTVDPAWPMLVLAERRRAERAWGEGGDGVDERDRSRDGSDVTDLIAEGLRVLRRLIG